MNVDQHAPVFQTKTIFINASPERVWSVLTEINRWPAWNPKITKTVLEGQPVVGAKFQWTVNGFSLKSILHTAESNRVFGWTGVGFGATAIHNWRLESQNGGTLVVVEESMGGWLVRLFKKKMNRDLAADMVFWLERMKEESEG